MGRFHCSLNSLAKLLIVFGFLLKLLEVWFLSFDVDADSSIVGLMGLHIMQGKELPVFYYGQAYMGSIEAFLVAFSFKLFGVSPSSLFLVPTLFWVGFVSLNYLLVKRVFGETVSLLTSLLLAYPSSFLNGILSKAWGGNIETLFFGTLILLLALKIAERFDNREDTKRLFILLGFISGVAMWTHFLVLSYVVAALAIFIFKRRGIFIGVDFLLLSLFFLLGFFPVIVYNLFPGQLSSLANFALPYGGKGLTYDFLFETGQPIRVRLFWALEKLVRIGKFSLPLILGFKRDGGFVLPVFFLLPLAGLYASAAFWFILDRDQVIRDLFNFAKVRTKDLFKVAPFYVALIATFSYAFGKFAFLYDIPRYLLPLYSFFPLLLGEFLLYTKKISRVLFFSGFAFVFLANLYSTYGDGLLPMFSKPLSRERHLIQILDELKINKVYTDYKTAYPITFLTKERIVASPKYSLDPDRYPEYTKILDKFLNPAFIFPSGVQGQKSSYENWFLGVLKKNNATYNATDIEGFSIYYNLSKDMRGKIEVGKFKEEWRKSSDEKV